MNYFLPVESITSPCLRKQPLTTSKKCSERRIYKISIFTSLTYAVLHSYLQRLSEGPHQQGFLILASVHQTLAPAPLPLRAKRSRLARSRGMGKPCFHQGGLYTLSSQKCRDPPGGGLSQPESTF